MPDLRSLLCKGKDEGLIDGSSVSLACMMTVIKMLRSSSKLTVLFINVVKNDQDGNLKSALVGVILHFYDLQDHKIQVKLYSGKSFLINKYKII